MAFSWSGAMGGAMQGGSAAAPSGNPWAIGGAALAGGLLGGLTGGDSSSKTAKELLGRQMDRQEIWMKNQMLWRVEDAKRAGIHPLAAIGSNITAPSVPGVSVGDVGGDLSGMGQNIGRAIGSMMTDDAKYETTLRALQVERGELENQVLLEQLKKLKGTAGTPPSFPNLAVGESAIPVGQVSDASRYPSRGVSVVPLLPGQGNAIENKGSEQFSTVPGQPSMHPTSNPSSRWMDLPTGGKAPMPGEAWQIDEAGAPGYFMWMAQNGLIPALPFGQRLVPAPSKKYELPGQTGWTYKVGLGWLPDFRKLTGWEKLDQQWAPLAPR